MLDRGGRQAFADFEQQCAAGRMRICEYANLDQLMAVEAAVDFLHDGSAEAAFADHDDGVQCVGAGAKFASLRGIDFEDHDGGGVYQVPVATLVPAGNEGPLRPLAACS